jgi:hypothetical protein
MPSIPPSPPGHGLPGHGLPARGLAVPVAVALAVKAVALAVIYLAFFVPPRVLTGTASAILGVPR